MRIEEKIQAKTREDEFIQECKDYEQNNKLFQKRINDYTIVCCKREERLKEYESSINANK